jgi:hypothetical protein
MKKIIFVVLVFLLQAASCYAADSVVFISSESSRSMVNPTTYAYFQMVQNKFPTIYIVRDIDVANNTQEWRDAYADASLIFLTGLSDEVLTTRRDNFCGNLSKLLTQFKGIVFAGNAAISSATGQGCLYTSFFNLADPSNNTELKNNQVNITKQHKITYGYNLKPYNISINDTIYTVNSPKGDYEVLAEAYGDPDGGGLLQTAFYPAITIWKGLTYRVVAWSINTSEIDCEDCLGWNIFNQALDWVSNTSDMGFRIETDKDVYGQGQTIYIDVVSTAVMNSVSGNITRPDGVEESLYFTGSGTSWSSYYPLLSTDPNGIYKINVNADGILNSKEVKVRAFYLNVSVKRIALTNIGINVDVLSQTDGYYKNVNVSIDVLDPLGDIHSYTTEDGSVQEYEDGRFYLLYHVENSGEHTIFVKAIDNLGRTANETVNFTYYPVMNITLSPENLTLEVHEAKNLSFIIKVINNGADALTNITLVKRGDIKDWINFPTTTISRIEPGSFTYFYFNLTIPSVEEGNYTGYIILSSASGEKEFPITVKLEYVGHLVVEPNFWEEYASIEDTLIKEFNLTNTGEGELRILEIKTTGTLGNLIRVLQKPTFLDPGIRKKLKVGVVMGGITIPDTSVSLSGNLKIITNSNNETIAVSLIVVKNLEDEANSLISTIGRIESEIDELEKEIDVSSLRSDLAKLNTELEDVKLLYQQKNYKEAEQKFRDVKRNIDVIQSEIIRLQEEVKERKAGVTRTLMIFSLMSIILLIAVMIYFRIIKPKRTYKWLYEKWKR